MSIPNTAKLAGQLLFLCRRSVWILSILLLPAACHQAPSAKLYQQQLFAFGTLIDISLITDQPAQAQAAINAVSHELDRLHRLWHPWQGGELASVNRQLPSMQAIPVSRELAGLIPQSSRLSEQSNGLFNPAIGKLIRLWQFDKLEDENFHFTLPDPQKIQQIVSRHPRMSNLKLTRTADNTYLLQSDNPAVSLDFGAYAKGVAIEKILAIIKRYHIHNALINAGGDLKAIGSKAVAGTSTPWHIGIKNPQNTVDPTQPAILAAIDLHDGEALFSSGDYERFFTFNNHHYHHIIDPRTGYPGQGVRAVTILDTDAGRADAAATAIFLAGPELALDIARNMAIKHLLIMTSDKRLYISPDMAARVQFRVDYPVIILKDKKPIAVTQQNNAAKQK